MPPKNEKCKICETNTVNKTEDVAIECDICQEWVCFDCTGLPHQMHQLIQTEQNIDFLCTQCKEQLPSIRELMTLKQQMNQEAETNKNFREAQKVTNDNLDKRLARIEKVMEENNLYDENFPPIHELNEEKEKLNKFIEKQQKLSEVVKKQKEAVAVVVKQQRQAVADGKYKEDRAKNLIVYGVPEEHEDVSEQMKTDYNTIKYLYRESVQLPTKDISQISRLGPKKQGQVRPIRITFSNTEKRLEILRNNKNLILDDENFAMCTAIYCEDKQKHKHIYVTTDKTKQERDIEAKLRTELNTRKQAGEQNLIIRNFKIITKTQTPTHPRWADVIENDDW